MSTFLFLQRFENGRPVALPYAKTLAALGRYGKAGRGRGDAEITFAPDTIAAGCTVIGNEEAGVTCIGFERPLYDEALRRAVWDCMVTLECAAFTDTLDSIYVLPGRARTLPGDWGTPTPGLARQTTTALQLWPADLEMPVENRTVPAALYPNPNPNGPNRQLFDLIESSPQTLTIEIGMVPAACNPGTLRVLRNLELRVAAAIQRNPEFALSYRFAHHETSLLFLESPRLSQEPGPQALIITPPPPSLEAPSPKGPRFVADRAVAAAAGRPAETFVEIARSEYKIELDGTFNGLDKLSRLLDAAHERHKQERRSPDAGKTAKSLAVLGGAYLGNIIQRFVGGQWGFMPRADSRRRPAIRMHNGQIRYPHLQVFDHVINGRSDDVMQWALAVEAADRSPTPRNEDVVGNVAVFCQILLGASRFAEGGLPLEAQIPRSALDFSIESLREFDRYLVQVASAAQAGKVSSHAMSNLHFVAGAYLGEVIRSNTADPALWTWVNYDDFAQANPEFRKKRPRESGFLAFLDSPKNMTYPFAHVAALLQGAPLPACHAFALQLIGTAPTRIPGARAAMPEDSVMKQALTHVRDALAKWRRLATPTDFLALRMPGPDWVSTHPLNEVVTQQPLLLQKGTVVWGALLQANNALFQKGPDDHPGAVLYSSDPYFEARPQELRAIAHKVFSYKGKDAPEDVRRISDWLTDEQQTAYNLGVPPSLTSYPAFATAVLFFRKHLPEQHIAGTWMPLLMHSSTRAVIVVPRQFWPRELIERWKARNLDIRP